MLISGIAIVALSGLAGCGTPAPSSSAPAPTGAAVGDASAVPVTLSDYMITPMQIRAGAGVDTFAVTNRGKAPHNFTVADGSGAVVAHTENLQPGSSATLTVTLTVGHYPFLCTEPGHASLGMTGTITVG